MAGCASFETLADVADQVPHTRSCRTEKAWILTCATRVSIAARAWKLAKAEGSEASGKLEVLGMKQLADAFSQVRFDKSSGLAEVQLEHNERRSIAAAGHARNQLAKGAATSAAASVAIAMSGAMAQDLRACLQLVPGRFLPLVASLMSGHCIDPASLTTDGDALAVSHGWSHAIPGAAAAVVHQGGFLAARISQLERSKLTVQLKREQAEAARVLAHAPPLLVLLARASPLADLLEIMAAVAGMGRRAATQAWFKDRSGASGKTND